MQRSGDPTGGEALFVSQLPLIERVIAFVSSREHLAPSEIDDFSSSATLRLIENDYAILRAYQGRSSLRTYLTVVIRRLLLDYRAKLWGKWRPSADARRGGALAIHLERLLVRDGYTLSEAYELLTTTYGVRVSRQEIDRLAATLPVRERRRFEDETALFAVASQDSPPDAALEDAERSEAAGQVHLALLRALGGFAQQDRLVLTLRFIDGRSVAAIAAALKLDQKKLYRRIGSLLQQLRSALEAQGVDALAVRNILATHADPVETADASLRLLKGSWMGSSTTEGAGNVAR